ncbi:TerD family protein [Bacillus sp. CMF12]|uniref:TerD family protein n=1 Tax=Bacillaceae TaxID=186817 RepID=UPI001FB266AD|nr:MULTISPECIES: TerD family protein [Bacillaceae]UOE55844.1 TerD family protein [Cytobacillus oceanisediminis]USK50306.1 TerD family protein [Bacillus sp. CMF12]
MGVRLSKGQKVDLTKTNPGLQVVVAGLGWDVSHNQSQYDLDASAFLTGASGKVQSDSDFVFYNNPSGGNGSILYSSDNRTGAGAGDDEQIRIELNKVPQHIHRIAFSITIHDAQMKGQNFGQVSNAYVRIFNAMTNEELLRFDLGRDFTVETAIVAAELYRHNGEWKFNAIASGFQGGLAALCRNFGVSVDDEPDSSPQPSFSQNQYQQQAHFGQPAQGFSPQQNQQEFSQQAQSGYSPLSFGQPAYNQASYNTPPSQPSSFGGQTGFGQPVQAQSYTDGNIACTRCGSTNIRTGQKGFGLGKAAIGGLILGPVGLLGGFIGKNQLKLTCNSCGNSWSPNQTDYAQWANDQKRRAQELFTRFKSQDVLDAVVASCALVGMADGRLDPSERQKMVEFVNSSQELKVFDTQKVIQQFNMFVQRIEMDPIIGRAEAFKAVGRVRNKPEIARLVARYCIAIGYADGNFDQNEKQAVTEICMELGLNPHEFLS